MITTLKSGEGMEMLKTPAFNKTGFCQWGSISTTFVRDGRSNVTLNVTWEKLNYVNLLSSTLESTHPPPPRLIWVI